MLSDGKISHNHILLSKIESFIKKFYLNRLIQGALIGSVILILFFLIFNGIEYFSWFSEKFTFSQEKELRLPIFREPLIFMPEWS